MGFVVVKGYQSGAGSAKWPLQVPLVGGGGQRWSKSSMRLEAPWGPGKRQGPRGEGFAKSEQGLVLGSHEQWARSWVFSWIHELGSNSGSVVLNSGILGKEFNLI